MLIELIFQKYMNFFKALLKQTIVFVLVHFGGKLRKQIILERLASIIHPQPNKVLLVNLSV